MPSTLSLVPAACTRNHLTRSRQPSRVLFSFLSSPSSSSLKRPLIMKSSAVFSSTASNSTSSSNTASSSTMYDWIGASDVGSLPYRSSVPSSPSIKSVSAGDRFECGPALRLQVDATCGRARALTIHLPHGPVRTPVFMPVGTQGTIKGLTSAELQLPPLDCEIILGNTYHLGNRPGGDTLEALGGLHSFMAWPRNILTDSGGFQMVSLLALAEITEEGVTFASPVDGSRMLLTPEMSMHLQNQIGSDILMALDDVVDAKAVDAARFAEACHRTLRWIDRCIGAHKRPLEQSLYGIVQGGLDVTPGGLRDICLEGMVKRDASLPGYAIGGLAGGEEKSAFSKVVHHCAAVLPPSKPLYLMGVGYPLDIVICTALGVDQYDCVYPTRTARFGSAMMHSGLLKIRHGSLVNDLEPIDPTCPCYICAGTPSDVEEGGTAAAAAAAGGGTTCISSSSSLSSSSNSSTSSSSSSSSTSSSVSGKVVKTRHYSRAYLNHLFKSSETTAAQLVTYHNIAYMMRLTREMREAIIRGVYPDYVRAFVRCMFPDLKDLPAWVAESCTSAGFDLSTAPTDAWCISCFTGIPKPNSVPSANIYVGIERVATLPSGKGASAAAKTEEID